MMDFVIASFIGYGVGAVLISLVATAEHMRRKKEKDKQEFKKGDKVVIRGKNIPNRTYPLNWTHEDEKELNGLYERLKLSYSMYEHMVALEVRRECATGLPTNRMGSRARVEFMEREARERKTAPTPLQAALARNKKSQDDLSAAVQRLGEAVDRRLAREKAMREIKLRVDKILEDMR